MAQSTVKVPCLGGEMLIEKWRYVQIDDNKLDMVKKRYTNAFNMFLLGVFTFLSKNAFKGTSQQVVGPTNTGPFMHE